MAYITNIDVNSILDQIKDYKGISGEAELRALLGISKQRLYHWRTRGSYAPDIVHKALPELSYQWLTTGEGHYLDLARIAPQLWEENKELRELIRGKDRLIIEQATHIDDLTQRLLKRR